MGTSKAAEMNSKEKVLSVYPDAQCIWTSRGWRVVPGIGMEEIGRTRSAHVPEDAAWDDAASKLPSAPSPAGPKWGDPLAPVYAGEGNIEWVPEPAPTDEHPDGEWVRYTESAAPIAPAAVSESTILQILKDCCDRDWKDETPEQVAVIVSNAMFWRNDEIRRLRDKLAKPSAEGDGWIAVTERKP